MLIVEHPISAQHAAAAKEFAVKWQMRPIPILRQTADHLKMMQKSNEEHTPTAIANVVLTDPLLTAQVLRHIRSIQRRSAVEMITMENAVIMLGVKRFLETFSSLPIVETVLGTGSHYYARLLEVLAAARLSALFSKTIVSFKQDLKVEELYLSSLLHNIPLCLSIFEAAESHVPMDSYTPVLLHSVYDNPLYLDIVSALFECWNMPEVVIDLLTGKGAAKLLSRQLVTRVACKFANTISVDWFHPDIQPMIEHLGSEVGCDTDLLWQGIVADTLNFTRRLWRYPHFPTPARWLALTPGGRWPHRGHLNLKTLREVEKEIEAHLDYSLNLNQMMGLVFKALQFGIGLERIIFYIYTPSDYVLKPRFSVGVPSSQYLKTESLYLDPKMNLQQDNLFTLLMQRQGAVWVNPQQPQLQSMVPETFRIHSDSQDFFVGSLFIGTNPVGLLFGDRRVSRTDLDEGSYNGFNEMVKLAANGLAHLARGNGHPHV